MKKLVFLGLVLMAGCAATPPLPTAALTLSALSLAPTAWSAQIGEAKQVAAKMTWSNGSVTEVSKDMVQWSSSATDVAKVDAAGNITALAAGQTTVTAVAVQAPTIKGTMTVTVQGVPTSATTPGLPAGAIQIKADHTTLKPGEQLTLNAVLTSQTAAAKGLTWASSNPNVITADPMTGQVNALQPGEAVVTVTSTLGETTVEGQITLYVRVAAAAEVPVPAPLPVPPVPAPPAVSIQSVQVTPSTLSLQIGAVAPLVVAVKSTGDADKTVEWSSSNAAVASVDAVGRVTAKSAGQAVIVAKSASDGSKVGTATVSVAGPAPLPAPALTIDSVSLSPGVLALNVGATGSLQADVKGTADKALTWTSSAPAVVIVDATGHLNALGSGQAVITATSVFDNSKLATANVTVNGGGLVITPGDLALPRGAVGQLTANAAVSWKSSDTGLVKIASNGRFVTGIKAGQATVTATAVDGRTTTSKVSVENHWLTGEQLWRAIDADCTISLSETPNTAVEISVALNGHCPASVPMQVVDGNSTVLAKGAATPGQPYRFTFGAKKDARVYLQVFRDGTINGEPAAFYYWSGTDL